ncbi:unnamed protein product, partial [Vitis vinifera]
MAASSINKSVQDQASSSINIELIANYESDPDKKQEDIKAYLEKFKILASQSLSEVIEKHNRSDHPAKILVYDSIMPWAQDLAEPLGLEGARFFTQSCAVSTIYYHANQGAFKNPLEGSTVSLPSMPILGINDMPSFMREMGSYPASLALLLNQFLNLQKVKWVFFNTFNKLEDESHINPMLQFSKRLISKGLKVTLVATTSIDAKSMPTSINIELIPDGLDRKEKKSVDASMQLFETVVSQSLPELIEKHSKSDHPANVLVYDASMPWAHGIAERLGLVGAAFFTQSCAVTAIYHYVSQGVEIPVKGPTLPMPFMPPLGIDDLPSFVKDPGSYPAVWSLISKQVSTFQKVKWALFNSFDKLEDEVVKWLANHQSVKTIGPTIPSM